MPARAGRDALSWTSAQGLVLLCHKSSQTELMPLHPLTGAESAVKVPCMTTSEGSEPRIVAVQRAQAAAELTQLAKRVRRTELRLEGIRHEQARWLRIGATAGLSLAELAALSGVSRQAVQQRLGGRV